MGKIVFVEHLDRKGRVVGRVRIDSFPATIGRAYTNSMIIDDRFVSPEHIRISESDAGKIMLEDMASVNGAFFAASEEKFLKTELNGEVVIRIGTSVLRVRDRDYKVEGALQLKPSRGGFFRQLALPAPAAAVFITSGIVFGLSVYLGSYSQFEAQQLIGSIVVLSFLLAVWAGFWCIVNRIVAHSFTFIAHLSLASLGLAAFEVSETFFEYWAFLMPGFYWKLLPFAGAAAVLLFLLYGHLSVFSAASVRRRFVSSLVVAVLIAGGIGSLSSLVEDKRETPVGFSSVLKPVSTSLLRADPAAKFFSGLQGIKKEADELAEEK